MGTSVDTHGRGQVAQHRRHVHHVGDVGDMHCQAGSAERLGIVAAVLLTVDHHHIGR
jgi:hypothetical protein